MAASFSARTEGRLLLLVLAAAASARPAINRLQAARPATGPASCTNLRSYRLRSGAIGKVANRLWQASARRRIDPAKATLEQLRDQPKIPSDSDEGVAWLPFSALDGQISSSQQGESEVVTVPVFPLGSVYLPGAQEILQIFEPRYREMYEKTQTGDKMIGTMLVKDGKMAEYGSLMEVTEVQDVSEQTNDQIKYVVVHDVKERIKVKRIVNPGNLQDTSTFLQAEVEILRDSDEEFKKKPVIEEDLSEAEWGCSEIIKVLADLQEDLQEPVRFSKDVVSEINMRTESWKAINLWNSYMSQLHTQKYNEMQEATTKVIMDHFKKIGREVSGRVEVNFNDLPRDIQDEVAKITLRFQEATRKIGGGPYPFQRLLQANSHKERLELFYKLLNEHVQGLLLKKLERKK